jgi:hypothetical protein
MTMKRFFLTAVLALSGLVVFSMPMWAGTMNDGLNVGDTIGINYDSKYADGPFTINVVGTGTSFFSFCIESQQVFHPTNWTGEHYNVSDISYNVMTDPQSSLTTLSEQAAYLYYSFRNGSLGVDTNKVNEMNDLQYAIWFWEQELRGVNNQFGTSYFAGINPKDLEAVYANVKVFNPTYMKQGSYAEGTHAQSFMTVVKTPEPEFFILLVFSMVCLAITCRRGFHESVKISSK